MIVDVCLTYPTRNKFKLICGLWSMWVLICGISAKYHHHHHHHHHHPRRSLHRSHHHNVFLSSPSKFGNNKNSKLCCGATKNSKLWTMSNLWHPKIWNILEHVPIHSKTVMHWSPHASLTLGRWFYPIISSELLNESGLQLPATTYVYIYTYM